MSRWVICRVFALSILGASSAHAEPISDPPPIPRFESDPLRPTSVLPPIRMGDVFGERGGSGPESTSPGPTRSVSRFVLDGNRSLRSERIEELVAPFVDRPVSISDLEILRDLIRLEYQRKGFVGTRVELADQGEVIDSDGVVRFEVTEMRLGDVFVTTDGSLRQEWVAARLRSDPDETIDVGALERRVQRLQRDERVRRVDAELVPSDQRGVANLRVLIKENRKLSLFAGGDSSVSPLVGGIARRLGARHTNVWGRGHLLEVSYTGAEGLSAGYVRYALPIGSRGTTLDFTASAGDADIVDGRFESLDVESRAASYAVRLMHPLLEDGERSLGLSLSAEHRRSQSFLLGEGFGVEDGLVKVSVLRFSQNYEQRGVRHALRLESTFSLGVDALRATQLGDRQPDGSFFAWKGSGQYLYELGVLRSQLALRGEVQLAEGSLPGLERIAVGGRRSVRGYRESALVRDNAAVGSIELRVPVWKGRGRRLELVPHVDVGFAWNESRELEDRRLIGAGLTARLAFTEYLTLELGWAADLKRLKTIEDDDFQDHGVYFGIVTRY